MIFDECQLGRLGHVADGKPIPDEKIKPWDRLLTIDVPQDRRGTFRKKETAEIWKLVAHVRRHTASEEIRVLAAGVEACIEELQKMSQPPVRPDRIGNVAPTWSDLGAKL